jgi:hypothetical protein
MNQFFLRIGEGLLRSGGDSVERASLPAGLRGLELVCRAGRETGGILESARPKTARGSPRSAPSTSRNSRSGTADDRQPPGVRPGRRAPTSPTSESLPPKNSKSSLPKIRVKKPVRGVYEDRNAGNASLPAPRSRRRPLRFITDAVYQVWEK